MLKTLSNYISYTNIVSAVNKFDFDKYLSKSLKFKRSQMPQIYDKHFTETVQYLADNYNCKELTIQVNKLKPTQNEINVNKIKNKITSDSFDISKLSFIVSKHNHIADGHHSHVAALITNPNTEVKIYKVDLDTNTLIKVLNSLKTTSSEQL